MSIESLARPEIVAMKPYSSARSEADSGGILLNANESPWPLVEDPLASEANAGDDGVGPLNRYPEPQHARLIEHLAGQYDVECENVLLTRGSDEGIDLLVRVFCRAGRDAILDTPPSFGMYRIAAQTQGARIIEVPREPDTLALDTPAVLKAVAGNSPPRLVFLTSPANPTGDVLDESFVVELLEAAKGKSVIVVDEAYAEFCEYPGFVRLVTRHENLAVLRTLSKAYGAAGLRCGCVVAQPGLLGLLRRILPPYPLASPVLTLALQLFGDEARARQASNLEAIQENKRRLLASLEGRPFVHRIWPGEANFVLLRVDHARQLVDHCARAGITIRMFSGSPLLENCVRISVGSDSEMMRLDEALDSFGATAETSG